MFNEKDLHRISREMQKTVLSIAIPLGVGREEANTRIALMANSNMKKKAKSFTSLVAHGAGAYLWFL